MRRVPAALRETRRQAAHAVGSARRRVVDDLRSDPYLPYILLLAGVLAGFWIWHRLPNFATRDERWRVVDPIETVAALSEGVSYDSLKHGVTYWRSYGATFYTSGLLLVPVAILAVVAGQFEPFLDMGRHNPVDFWEHWLRTPGWLWTASVLVVRLWNVVLTVASVYVVYRIGTRMRDRATGRLAALLTTLTWGVLVLAHEAGEGIPALFSFLVAVYLALAYLETGRTRTFYWGCVAGGLATAMKLNAGVSALLLGAAFLLRAHRGAGERPWRERYVRPRFLLGGMGIGAALILGGYPDVLVGDPAELGGRLARLASEKNSPHGWLVRPSWWWMLRGYLHGLGLPLFVAAVLGALASLRHVRGRSREADGLKFALLGTWLFVSVYAPWAYIRTHHLLLTFPLLALVVAAAGQRLRARWPTVGRVCLAALLVTSGAYAVGGDLAYASQPRDQATAYVAGQGPNVTVETYTYDPQEAAVPHDATIYQPRNRTMRVGRTVRSLGVRKWTLAMPHRCPDYIVLGYHRSLLYLAPDSWSNRADGLDDGPLTEYYRDLLAEDTYAYEVAGEFGRRPRFLDGEGRRPTWRRLLRVGVRPRTMQYGDPQDLGVDQYTVVLANTGECAPEEHSPFADRLGPSERGGE